MSSDLRATRSAFRILHEQGCFVIPNPWDIGSARMMAAAGAKALATSSAALAFTLGRPDMGRVTREESLKHAEDMVRATPLPVSGDFENGFADAPDDVAETIRLALESAESQSQGRRWAALRILAYFGDQAALPVFLRALDSEDARVRDIALGGLALLDSPAALDALLASAASCRYG